MLEMWWKPAIEIAILWFVIYRIILFFEGSRAIHVMRGIIILIVAFFLFQKLNLEVLSWLLTKLFGISIITILIIFHPEIRQGLARLGQRHLFTARLKDKEIDYILAQVARAAEDLCKNKIGALIAIEKNDPLTAYIESGVIIDAQVSPDLIETIFTPNSLLHDGGLILQHGRIMAAGCLLPLTQNPDLSRIYGTRHRAALGLSEETDAVIVIVSEERHDMSLVYRSRLYRDLSADEIIAKAKQFLKMSGKGEAG